MADLPTKVVFDVFIATILFLLASLLLVRSRRFPGNGLLVTFLALVGFNFLGLALETLTADGDWAQAAYVALALDPLFLLAFVAIHPYPRWTPIRVALLVWLALVATISVPLILWRPELVIAYTFGAPMDSPARLLLLGGGLGVGYAAAWFTSVQSLREAPTLGLAQRSIWTTLAVGVAVLPRLPLLITELSLLPRHGPLTTTEDVVLRVLVLLAELAVASALFWPAVMRLRKARMPSQETRRLFRTLGLVVLALLAAQSAFAALAQYADPAFTFNIPFGFRWVIFAGVLAYAVSAHQVIPLPGSNRTSLPLAGGLVVATAAALACLSQALGWTDDGTLVLGIAALVGAAAFMPGVWMTRKAILAVERLPTGYADVERRLTVYRAALESAWARGTPGPEAKRRLNGLRQESGLSRDEAKVLEHVVREAVRRSGQDLTAGQEPFPGIVIEEVLGAGSQGQCFLARALPSRQRFVVKQLGTASGALDAQRKLRNELQALSRMQHPNLPRLLDFSLADTPLLLYEFVDGQPLARRLRAGPLPTPVVAVLTNQLADALAYVHSHGKVHGDVKPENIVLDDAGKASLVDFGLVHDAVDARGTIASWEDWRFAVGTMAYMAPERARGEAAGPASDWYSLGLTLAEALMGHPARRLSGMPLHKALEAVSEGLIDLEALPEDWRVTVSGLLEEDPATRALLVGKALRMVPAGPGRPSRRLPSDLEDQEGATRA